MFVRTNLRWRISQKEKEKKYYAIRNVNEPAHTRVIDAPLSAIDYLCKICCFNERRSGELRAARDIKIVRFNVESRCIHCERVCTREKSFGTRATLISNDFARASSCRRDIIWFHAWLCLPTYSRWTGKTTRRTFPWTQPGSKRHVAISHRVIFHRVLRI